MNRPYTVCHIFSALDGAITGNYMTTTESRAAQKQYGEKREFFNCNAILYGTTTMRDFCDGYVRDLLETMPAAREDYISPNAKGALVVAVDRHGRLAYSNNYLERHGRKQHIIEVLTENVSSAYINYLRSLDISYIFAGKDDLDCVICMEKLRALFGIERLMIAGGGYIDWAFADAGMIDELSLVLAPAADGEQKVTVFERTEKSKNRAIGFALKEVKRLEGDAVWLIYDFNNAKK
ncbi:MAG: dihydrofolate reductase family protein [Eubacteriales bacterium]